MSSHRKLIKITGRLPLAQPIQQPKPYRVEFTIHADPELCHISVLQEVFDFSEVEAVQTALLATVEPQVVYTNTREIVETVCDKAVKLISSYEGECPGVTDNTTFQFKPF